YKPILEAIKDIPDLRVVLQKGWGTLKDITAEDFIHIPTIPHTYLFPKCCAVMHHGGAGTTAMGLDFGLPTSVISFFGDQWIWGSLVQLHGAGKFLRREHVEPQAVKACLEFSITSGAKAAAKRLQESFREERKRGMGAHEGALGFQRQLPLELVTCPVCAVALSESQGVLVTPLRTADWGRTRGGILYVHFVRGLKAGTRLFVRMVQGGQTGGVSGFLI
ncbi:hypothetical protein Pmar_PMAR004885, partial [Perkinsus marinus ATCC 50983]